MLSNRHLSPAKKRDPNKSGPICMYFDQGPTDTPEKCEPAKMCTDPVAWWKENTNVACFVGYGKMWITWTRTERDWPASTWNESYDNYCPIIT